jgi:hypothetical protein
MCLTSLPLHSQSTPSPSGTDSQAITLLTEAASALQGAVSVADVSLSGVVRRISGSDDETGTFALEGTAKGSARLSFTLSSGVSTEIFNLTGSPAGAWSGPDGISHPVAFHNLLTEQVWFCPNLVIAHQLSSAVYIASYIGHETFEGQAVEHVSLSQIAPIPDQPHAVAFEHLTRIEFYLDSSSFLPVAITYNVHPDNNALVDVPVQSRFSDYRSVSGIKIPFHIQKFLNNTLIMDLETQTAAVNSGISTTVFNVQ